MTSPPRKHRVWTVADFARHVYRDDSEPVCRRARRFLKRLDAKHGGQLLIPSPGANRQYHFYPAVLARLESELFQPIESLEFRVEALEETVEEGLDRVAKDQRMIAATVGQHSRDIAKHATQLALFRRAG